VNWASFFPAGTPVIALPSWERPRLYVAAWNLKARWWASSLYPASRLGARLFRFVQRTRAVLGLATVREARGAWALESFLKDAGWEGLVPWAVLVGTRGPAQKMTVQLRSPGGEIVAYLKYGESEVARRRIAHEYEVLKGFPRGLAPKPLFLSPIREGVGLLISAVRGRPVAARAAIPDAVLQYAATMPVVGRRPLSEHPWIVRLLGRGGSRVESWLHVLESREWAVLPQHGDFAPWNLLQDSGQVRAIDWEYGTLEGFPGTDLAYYLLQTSALIHRWPPEKARARAAKLLASLPWPELSYEEADDLLRLTAYDAYLKAMDDGHDANEPLQVWRRAVSEVG